MTIIDAISRYLGIPPSKVEEIGSKAPSYYRRYFIQKKSGGQREIFHPAKESKALQSAAVDLLYRDEFIHSSVKGYVRGLKSPLAKNASEHAGNAFLLKLDFSDFFPSINPIDFETICCPKLLIYDCHLTEQDIVFLTKLFFVHILKRGWFLGIGAPSSPFVSNWVMYNLDREIHRLCADQACAYTRYADDICISSNIKSNILNVERVIRELVTGTANPRLLFNDDKRRLSSRGSRRSVTGMIITPRGEIKVPRSIKRYVRFLLHKLTLNTLTPLEKARLGGFLGYIKDCEPAYLHNLAMKFSADTICEGMKVKR
jgi:RNA-directed DNA polymerase